MGMDGFRTIDMMISKKTLLPTAKTMKGNRNRNRHVNSNHSDFDAAHKIPGGITITGKNRSSVAEGIIMNQIQSFLVVIHTNRGKNGTEDFFFIDFHFRTNLIEKCPSKKKTILVPLNFVTSSVHQQFCTLINSTLDQTFNTV